MSFDSKEVPLNPRIFLDIEYNNSSNRIIIELYQNKAPKAVDNFKKLCTGEPGFSYLRSLIHRIIAPEFLVQGGDITENDGTGGKSIYGKPFENENLGWNRMTEPGLVCMANKGPNTVSNTSQFFITLCPTPWLSDETTVFGKVVFGIKNLLDLQLVPIDSSDRALDKVHVKRCGELRLVKNAGRGIQEKSTNSITKQGEPHIGLNSRSDGRSRTNSDTFKPDTVSKNSNSRTSGEVTSGLILKGRGTMKFHDKKTRYN